ncbi:hypothetical protein HK102_010013 [Quaeritorhiza haematococci]|nr:hypothetical protein HK102_010013 [Quaeritorhiza haematococci]
MSRWNCTVTDWPADHAYFAVFDGHGGDTVSEHASNNLHAKIIDAKRYDPARYPGFTPSWEDAIRNGFDAEEREIEKQIIGGTPEDVALGRVAMREGGTPPPKGGATAVVVLFLPDEKRLLVANVGDSRAILASTDKAEPEEEFVQIAKAEGAKIVDFEARPGEGSGKRQEGGGKEVDILKDADEAMQESAPETIVPLAKGVPATVRRLTHDDTPDAKSEKMRVQLAGGRIVAGRVGEFASLELVVFPT